MKKIIFEVSDETHQLLKLDVAKRKTTLKLLFWALIAMHLKKGKSK